MEKQTNPKHCDCAAAHMAKKGVKQCNRPVTIRDLQLHNSGKYNKRAPSLL